MEKNKNHVCVLRDPETIQTIGSRERSFYGVTFTVLFGIKRAEQIAESVEQSVLYPASVWTEEKARSHCSEAGGIDFIPAKEDLAEIAAEQLKRATRK